MNTYVLKIIRKFNLSVFFEFLQELHQALEHF